MEEKDITNKEFLEKIDEKLKAKEEELLSI